MSFNGGFKQGLAWTACHDPTVDEVFLGGGARSGKSVYLCAHEIIEATTWPGTRGLIGRKEYETLRDSTLKTWWEVMGMFGYQDGRDFKWNGQDKEIRWSNGSLTMFRHLKREPGDPNFSRLGSTAFTRAAVDEADECEVKLVEMLLVRTGFNPPPHGGKVIVTGNPGDYWTKYRYVYTPEGNAIEPSARQRVILATVADNPDPIVRAEYTRRLEAMINDYDRERLLHGNWLIGPRTGLEFFPHFSASTHVRPCVYDPGSALHVSLDFNAVPYMTLLVKQIGRAASGRWEVRGLKEYCLAHPLNSTREVCAALARDLTTGCFAGHRAGLFYYGDYSGKARNTMATQTERHNYDVVVSMLGKWMSNNSDRVIPNPAHVRAHDFMDAIFSGRLPVDVFYDPAMTTTIRDLQHLKQGADGSILKEYGTTDGVRFEKYGHCSQASYYLICSAFREMFEEYGRRAA